MYKFIKLIKTRLFAISVVLSLLYQASALADTYEVYSNTNSDSLESSYHLNSNDEELPDNWAEFLIKNTTTNATYTINQRQITELTDVYHDLLPDAERSDPGDMIYYWNVNQTDQRDNWLEVTNIVGNNIYLSRNANVVTIQKDDGSIDYSYGREIIYDKSTNTIVDDKLIAPNQAAYDYAISKGFNVIGVFSDGKLKTNSFTSTSTNFMNDGVTAIKSYGGLVANGLLGDDSTSLIRKENDGTLHIGANSVIIKDSTISNNGNDQIYSSVKRLQLGDTPSHRTIVEGSLEIQNPTRDNHATTKKYVDEASALAMAIGSIPRSYNGKTMIGLGTGYIGNQTAVAIGLSKGFPQDKTYINVNIGHTELLKTSGSVGIGYEF